MFLAGTGLPERWKNLSANAVFTIAETGFGTGLNFLAAWQAWRKALLAKGQAALDAIQARASAVSSSRSSCGVRGNCPP